MTREQLFLQKYPDAFHVSLCADPNHVLTHGLNSAAGLLRFLPDASSAETLVTQRRSMLSVEAPWGRAHINDQKPLPRSGLLRCLVGLTPEQWYEELNRRIFFFVTRRAAERFAMVRATEMPARSIFVLDMHRMVETLGERLELSPINTGAAIRRASPRSRSTFQRIADYPLEQRGRAVGWSGAVAEMSVRAERLDITPLVRDHYVHTAR